MDGGQIGAFHRLWLYVFRNPLMFEPLFKEQLRKERELDEEEWGGYDVPLSAIDKIRYLYAIGGVDFIAKKGNLQSSANAISKVVAKIVGENPRTVQKIINAIRSEKMGSDHPAQSDKKMQVVHDFFLSAQLDRKELFPKEEI
jgi:hypothetical protein